MEFTQEIKKEDHLSNTSYSLVFSLLLEIVQSTFNISHLKGYLL